MKENDAVVNHAIVNGSNLTSVEKMDTQVRSKKRRCLHEQNSQR